MGASIRRWPVALAALAAALANCAARPATTSSPATSTSTPPLTEGVTEPVRIVLYGDSLAVEAAPFFAAVLTANGRADVRVVAFGGTAICDHLARMRADVAAFDPDAVVVEFSGNVLTPCVGDGRPNEAEIIRRYHADADAVMALYEPLGVPVYWIGTPVSRREAENREARSLLLNRVYAEMPHHHDRTFFVDAGQAVLRDGQYTDYLPCIPGEPCAGLRDPVEGRPANRIRGPDGVHFCPTPTGAEGLPLCAAWSSGAWRFGAAMARPLVQAFALALPTAIP